MFKLLKFLKPYWWQVSLLLLSTALQVYTTLRLPALMAEIINDGIVPGDTDRIWQIGFLMIGVTVVSAIASLISSYCSARVGSCFARDIRAEIFVKVLNMNVLDMKDLVLHRYSPEPLMTSIKFNLLLS